MTLLASTAGVRTRNLDSPDPDDFRATLRAFATGVTVVTSAGEAGPCGVTVNAFTSVSLEPALVLVCLGAGPSVATIARNRAFAVNVLNADQEWLSRRFASPARPRGAAAFRDVPHRLAATGTPILDGVASWLDCRLADLHVAGDHRIVVGEVLDLGTEPSCEPLVFHGGRYRAVRDRDRPKLTRLPPTRPPERR